MVMGLIAVLASGLAWYVSYARNSLDLRHDAQYFRMVSVAASKYISVNKNGWLDSCKKSGVCRHEVSLMQLKNEGFLIDGVASKLGKKYQQDIKLLVHLEPNNQEYSIQGLLISYGGEDYADSDLARMANNVGASAGYVSLLNDKEISGVNGDWASPVSDWANFSTHPARGHLAALVTGHFDPESKDVVEKGTIMLWNGGEVPDGWLLCDGKNGTPNLVDKFILGSTFEQLGLGDAELNLDKRVTSDSESGGVVDVAAIYLKNENMPDISIPLPIDWAGWLGGIGASYPDYEKSEGSTIETPMHLGKGAPIKLHATFDAKSHSHMVDVIPPYYRLVYIIKV